MLANAHMPGHPPSCPPATLQSTSMSRHGLHGVTHGQRLPARGAPGALCPASWHHAQQAVHRNCGQQPTHQPVREPHNNNGCMNATARPRRNASLLKQRWRRTWMQQWEDGPPGHYQNWLLCPAQNAPPCTKRGATGPAARCATREGPPLLCILYSVFAASG